MKKIWDLDEADRISDRIVDLMNEELRAGAGGVEILAGQMLAMCSFASTCPKSIAPPPYIEVMDAIARCLESMMAVDPQQRFFQPPPNNPTT